VTNWVNLVTGKTILNRAQVTEKLKDSNVDCIYYRLALWHASVTVWVSDKENGERNGV